MNLVINGSVREYTENCRSVADLMNHPDWSGRLVIVELNGQIVSKENYNDTPLTGGDRVEVVQFVGGG